MIDPVSLQIVRDLVAIFGVIAGFTYYVLTVRNSQRMQKMTLETRQAQLFMQLYNQWTNPALASSYGNVRYNERYNAWDSNAEAFQEQLFEPFDVEMWRDHHILVNFFEGVGVLVREGFIDINLVEKLLSRRIIWCWEYIQPWVPYDRKKMNDPNEYGSLEYLYNVMKQRQQLQAPVST